MSQRSSQWLGRGALSRTLRHAASDGYTLSIHGGCSAFVPCASSLHRTRRIHPHVKDFLAACGGRLLDRNRHVAWGDGVSSPFAAAHHRRKISTHEDTWLPAGSRSVGSRGHREVYQRQARWAQGGGPCKRAREVEAHVRGSGGGGASPAREQPVVRRIQLPQRPPW